MPRILIVLLLLMSANLFAESSIFKAQTQMPMDEVHQAVYQALEKERLWVVFEADIGRNLQNMAKRLGDNYNRNQLQGLRTMVVCNPWYANEVSNLDPAMLALCPLRLAIYREADVSTVLFARPSIHAQGSAALPVIMELEQTVISAIKSAVSNKK